MTNQFHELLLSELRMVSYRPGDPADLTDDRLCEAVTLNENLQSLGFALRPDDLLRLAASPSLDGFYDTFKALVPDVKAEPMYPGFPKQVMEMSEAEFRMHQMIHYFSTYGLEMLLGGEVRRGWLPRYDGPARTRKDTRLMEARVIELVVEEEAPIAVLKALLNRRERLTNPELALVMECAPLCSAEQLQGLKVRFKENLDLLFPMLMAEADRDAALRTLRAVCAHTGDVLRLAKDYLRGHRYHLRTADKRLLVKLLERYPVEDLRRNLMQSLQVRERNLVVLRHLDYNLYSRSPEHREAVRALRNGELLSWHGVGEALLEARSPEALAHLAQRPGYMVRMLNRLLSLGYGRQAITEALLPRAKAVSAHLIVRTVRTLARRGGELESKCRIEQENCREKYIDESFERHVRPLETRQEQVRRNAETRRLDVRRQYLDEPKEQARLQAYEPVVRMEEAIEESRKSLKEKIAFLKRMESLLPLRKSARIRWDANTCIDADLLYARLFESNPAVLYEKLFHCRPDEVRAAIAALEADIDRMQAERKALHLEAGARFKAEAERIEAENAVAYVRAIEAVDRWEKEAQIQAKVAFERDLAAEEERRNTLEARRDAELAQIQAKYDCQRRASTWDADAVEILKALLKAHFEQAVTPLKGKKVYFDLEQFDLAHSVLETEDRSKDGGYIRSGISYHIPEEAKIVRFFVYWNDPHHVDVDLHAGGRTLEGQNLHVGWNADFQSNGVVHSGDITHSYAAEYIDIDLSAPIREIYANVNLFSGKPSFKRIETCYVGLMAVDQAKQDVKLYDPANCFFTHRLAQNISSLFYGYIDVKNRCVRFVGKPNASDWDARPEVERADALFSLQDYLDCLLDAQGAERVRTPEQADVVLTMGKSLRENGVSLVDGNFFLEC